jgi:molecular chaperone GrpE
MAHDPAAGAREHFDPSAAPAAAGVSEQSAASAAPAAETTDNGGAQPQGVAPAASAPDGVGAVADRDGGQDAEVTAELDELAATAAQRDEFLALAQRTQADFENYRKRVARDAAAAEVRGLVRLARELLPALDNLDRALAHAGDADTDPVLIDGLRLVQRELSGALERAGIESYGAPGEAFDPELHEAVAQAPYEGRGAGEIAEVYQSGYRISGGGLIRPARVLVAG